jgi:hypothetical protein
MSPASVRFPSSAALEYANADAFCRLLFLTHAQEIEKNTRD